MRASQIDRYLIAYKDIPGWLDDLDFRLIVKLCSTQVDRNIKGDILEIGVYQGRTAILLGLLLEEGEQLVACDTFGCASDTSSENAAESALYYPGFGQSDFERHYLRFHESLPTILSCPSSRLPEVLERASCRFVHVDGGHTYEVVRSDLCVAKDLIGEFGVIACDDICAHHLPGTALAIWQQVLEGALIPFALTDWKLYVTRDEEIANYYADKLTAFAMTLPTTRIDYHDLAGHRVARIVPRLRSPQKYVNSGRNPSRVNAQDSE